MEVEYDIPDKNEAFDITITHNDVIYTKTVYPILDEDDLVVLADTEELVQSYVNIIKDKIDKGIVRSESNEENQDNPAQLKSFIGYTKP